VCISRRLDEVTRRKDDESLVYMLNKVNSALDELADLRDLVERLRVMVGPKPAETHTQVVCRELFTGMRQ
jgi:hypothetical protein